jgi:NAD(P)-dependent dehydrogenase (short-subunit alcohol dehydrogenase family)
MRERLEGENTVITGAGAGVGRASALRFAEEGARVACADLDLRRWVHGPIKRWRSLCRHSAAAAACSAKAGTTSANRRSRIDCRPSPIVAGQNTKWRAPAS